VDAQVAQRREDREDFKAQQAQQQAQFDQFIAAQAQAQQQQQTDFQQALAQQQQMLDTVAAQADILKTIREAMGAGDIVGPNNMGAYVQQAKNVNEAVGGTGLTLPPESGI